MAPLTEGLPLSHDCRLRYTQPTITDEGDLLEITAGCVGGIPEDSMAGADLEAFPADSGIFCE